MPHSSGGGHRGGGHHSSHRSSSHRSSSHRSRSQPRISSQPYPGSRRYRYRRRGRDHYFYTSRSGKIFQPARLLLGVVYIPFLLLIGGALFSTFAKRFQKYDTRIIVKDEANVLEDHAGLQKSLSDFYEKTHIVPAVVTVSNDTWQGHYTSLEDYAYSRYLMEFNDEMHWLIVYSEGTYVEPGISETVDWSWEGMQGDDTDEILTGTVTERFNTELFQRLEYGQEPVSDSIAKSFDLATSVASKYKFLPPLDQVLPGFLMLVFLGVHGYFMLGLNELKYRRAEPAPEETELPDSAGAEPSRSLPQQFSDPYQQSSAFSPQAEMPALVIPPAPQPFETPQAQGSFAQQQTFPNADPQMPNPFAQQQTFPNADPQMPNPFAQRQTFPNANPQMPNPFAQQQTFPNADPQMQVPPPVEVQLRPPVLPDPQAPQVQPMYQTAPQVQPMYQTAPQEQPAPQSATVTCRNCGMQYEDSLRYCPGCGMGRPKH